MTLAPINSSSELSHVASAVLAWYDAHRRHLPWRAAPGAPASPYGVWLSEIMLQQTTVSTVIPYFEAFMRRWPHIRDLAAAEREEVLRAWAGLGYYARARNLHACARKVSADLGGRFPQGESELRALPGIGPYTAAAIAAIAFQRPAVVVDGNIERIMARLHRVETPLPRAKPRLHDLAEALTPQVRPGDYAQGLMDIGAGICRPKAPSCPDCPLKPHCRAAEAGAPEDYPRREARKKRPSRFGRVYWLETGCGQVLLRRRPDRGLLGGMSEFPGSDWGEGRPRGHAGAPMPADWTPVPGAVRHVFTHFSLELEVFAARIAAGPPPPPPACRWTPKHRLGAEALPGLMRKVAALIQQGD